MRIAFAGGILLAAMYMGVIAQKGNASRDDSVRILFLEKAWDQAEIKHDAHALSQLTLETFRCTDSDGSFMDESRWLAHVKNGVDQYEQLASRGMAVHLYRDAAVVTGEYRERIKIKRKTIVRSGRFTDTWIQQDGVWKCAASQATLITP